MEVHILVLIRTKNPNLGINTLKDLALFLKNNVNLMDFTIYSRPGIFGGRKPEGVIKNAAYYKGCLNVLQKLLGLTRSQAEEAMNLLDTAGFIVIHEESFVDLERGDIDARVVQFKV